MAARLMVEPHAVAAAAANATTADFASIRETHVGAKPHTVFFKVVMPLILPGVISGALFAFVTSFDEVIVILFIGGPEQRTLPRQMFSGIREQISPTITAAASVLIVFSTLLLITVELLRRRGERLRGIRPS
jgi:putative spermidine/putrescine transport system permease protein